MPATMPDEHTVSFREFKQAIDDLRAYITVLHTNHAEASQSRHQSIGRRMDGIESTLEAFAKKHEAHEVEDEAVEDRVRVLEDGQRRLLWVTLALTPSGLAVWEGVKKALFHP